MKLGCNSEVFVGFHLAQQVLPSFESSTKVRLESAGCSLGVDINVCLYMLFVQEFLLTVRRDIN